MGRALRSAVLTLGVVLLVGCAPSPALPDRSAVKAELRGMIEDVPGATAYRYQLKDDRGYDMGPTKVIWAPEADAFAGIYFTWEDGPGGFVVHLATSSDLFSWDEQTAYSVAFMLVFAAVLHARLGIGANGDGSKALRLLARHGVAVPADRLERDWTQPYAADDAVEQAWLTVYRDPTAHWDLYQLGEELTDLEDAFRLWRFRHLTTVERVIGFKRGTGGTGGISYLRQMLDTVLFPEIWRLRTDL